MSYDAKVALLGGIIDYAGTFPPAALSLEDALKRAASWRSEGKHPWLMGKIALPLADIKKIGSSMLYQSGADGSPWLYTALGTVVPSETTPTEFYKIVEWDFREIRRCQERWFYGSIRQEIISYETKLPPRLTHSVSSGNVFDFVQPVLDRTGNLTGSEIRDFFFEVSLEGDWKLGLENTVQALGEWVDGNQELELIPGVKVRTGGALTPSAEQLAAVISGVTSHGLKFKATQGLHSAMTHGKNFGFVNVFGALAFAQGFGSEEFGVEQIQKCLLTEEKNQFKFSSSQFSWNEYAMNCEELEAARRRHGATFGSCSLDEPDLDLAKEF